MLNKALYVQKNLSQNSMRNVSTALYQYNIYHDYDYVAYTKTT